MTAKSPDHFDFPARAACLSAKTLSKNLKQYDVRLLYVKFLLSPLFPFSLVTKKFGMGQSTIHTLSTTNLSIWLIMKSELKIPWGLMHLRQMYQSQIWRLKNSTSSKLPVNCAFKSPFNTSCVHQYYWYPTYSKPCGNLLLNNCILPILPSSFFTPWSLAMWSVLKSACTNDSPSGRGDWELCES